MATHSNVLAWRIPGTGLCDGLWSMGSHRARHDWSDLAAAAALFVVMLSKAHLTSHTRMSGSRWVITPSWLSGSWRSFFYSSSVYSCHLFLISSASVRSIPFLSLIVPILGWKIALVSQIFLKRPQVFPILLFFSISLHWSLRKAYLSLLAVLWNSAFKWVYLSFSPLLFASVLFIAICNASSDSHFCLDKEDNCDFLQKVPCLHYYIQCP